MRISHYLLTTKNHIDMKTKTMIMLAALTTGLWASGQTLSAPDLTFDYENRQQPQALPFTLTLPEGGDFTNIELHLTFPEGLVPCMVDLDYYDEVLVETDDPENGIYLDKGHGVIRPLRGMNYSSNFDIPEKWPHFVIVGANIIKYAFKSSPNHFLTIFVKGKDEYTPGTRPMTAYMKYTSDDDSSHTIGSLNNELEICNITFTTPSAVDDLSADKTVDNVVYYNIAGQGATSPHQGMNIVVTHHTDGTQQVTKMVK